MPQTTSSQPPVTGAVRSSAPRGDSPLDRGGRRIAFDKLAVGLALVVGIIALGGAWGSQVIGGLVPCELCLDQRVAYYWGLPLIVAILVLWNRLPLAVWYVAMGLVIALFGWSLYMASYHAGVEWGFWPGPTACTGTGVVVNFDDLSNINATRVVPCDKVQFEMFGVSMAGLNVLASLLILGLSGAAVIAQARFGSRRRG